jgi:short-subunit dehydrogenase
MEKNIIITGASKGLGKAMAQRLAEPGVRLILCARNAAALEATTAEIQETVPGVLVATQAADLAQPEAVQRFAAFALSFGTPQILINNAGTFLPGNVYDEAEGFLEQMMATNLYSAYRLTRALLPAMMKVKTGHIFNVCSIASLKPYAHGGGYSISKYALHGFSQNLREEMKPYGIKVTGIYPGAVLTDSWGNFDNSQKRIMEASDVAEMVWAATRLSEQAVVEDIVLRPQLGDL